MPRHALARHLGMPIQKLHCRYMRGRVAPFVGKTFRFDRGLLIVLEASIDNFEIVMGFEIIRINPLTARNCAFARSSRCML